MYSQEYFQNLSKTERIHVLESNAENIGEQEYLMPMTDEELTAEKNKLSELCLAHESIMDEFKEVKHTFKERLKPVNEKITGSLTVLKLKGYFQRGRVFEFYTPDGKKLESYNEDGILVAVRDASSPDQKGRTLKFA